jgi:hypothetical protein
VEGRREWVEDSGHTINKLSEVVERHVALRKVALVDIGGGAGRRVGVVDIIKLLLVVKEQGAHLLRRDSVLTRGGRQVVGGGSTVTQGANWSLSLAYGSTVHWCTVLYEVELLFFRPTSTNLHNGSDHELGREWKHVFVKELVEGLSNGHVGMLDRGATAAHYLLILPTYGGELADRFVLIAFTFLAHTLNILHLGKVD